MIAHPDTCSKFVQCANGRKFIMDCGPGTVFNPAVQVCDWPQNVPGCSGNTYIILLFYFKIKSLKENSYEKRILISKFR